MRKARAFTLVELLVVIGIITILIAVMIPVVGRVKTSAYNTSTQALMSQIEASIEAYNNDFRAYPGPLANSEVGNNWPAATSTPPLPPIAISTDAAISTEGYLNTDTNFPKQITMSENLVLGLMGGLKYDATQTPPIVYDARLVGKGPNALSPSLPKHYAAYVADSKYLSWTGIKKTGHFSDDIGAANDSIIPEFLDTFPEGLPLLYMRAKRGATIDTTLPTDNKNNVVITYDPAESYGTAPYRAGQYDLHQIIGYTSSNIGSGRKPPTYVGWTTNPIHGLSDEGSTPIDVNETTVNRYPFGAYAYFRNQQLSTPGETGPTYLNPTAANPRNDVPRQKDGYILISAGPDRIYGTRDDLTNFGPVIP